MIRHAHTYTYITRLSVSLLLILYAITLQAQPPREDRLKVEKKNKADSIPLYRGIQVMVDLVGPIQKAVSDYGQYETGVRLNLKDRYFPIFELGYGIAEHKDDPNTRIDYKTSAPYFKIGVDFNILKNKHDIYRAYVGIRYAFTSYKYDVVNTALRDPVWDNGVAVELQGIPSNMHWGEILFALDAKIWGPIHLGWSARYRRRITSKTSEYGNVWYVPGFGITGNTRLGATFNIIVEI